MRKLGLLIGSGFRPTYAFAVPAGTTYNRNVWSDLVSAGWDGVTDADLVYTIPSGAIIGSTSTANAALNVGVGSAWPAGKTLKIINDGLIEGAGGAGGQGGSGAGAGGGAGGQGGYALSIGTKIDLFDNTNGNIWAGGGGGGGGGGAEGPDWSSGGNSFAWTVPLAGGAAGGGAGTVGGSPSGTQDSGAGGVAGQSSFISPGFAPTGGGQAGSGGTGGAPGQPGSAGSGGSSSASTGPFGDPDPNAPAGGPGGPGGAAGIAVLYNGNSVSSWIGFNGSQVRGQIGG